MIIRTNSYGDFKFLIAGSVGAANASFFDGGTYFVVYTFTTAFAVVCILPGKPATWAADLGVTIPTSIHQLDQPYEFKD